MNPNSKPNYVIVKIVFILIISYGSHASFVHNIRKLAQHKPDQLSPEISSSPSIAPAPEFFDSLDEEKCSDPSKTCHDDQNLTACVKFSTTAPKQVFLLVKNGGKNSLIVNVTISHVKAFLEMQIPGHQANKTNISANIGGSPSIVLNAGNGACIIYMSPQVSDGNNFKQFPSFATNLTPIHGAYFLFLTALIVGVTWACCKFGKRGQQVDGIPYQELEMGQPDSLSANTEEIAEGWDQGWDDTWEEIKEEKSPNGHQMGNVLANRLTSKSSDTDGWENNWDD